MGFQFVPSTGLKDVSQFPDEDPQIREHLQELLDQIPTYYDEQLNSLASASVNYMLGGNGYFPIKFKDSQTGVVKEIIIQFGNVNVSASQPVIFTFSKEFPNGCLNCIIGSDGVGNADSRIFRTRDVTKTGFNIVWDSWNSTTNNLTSVNYIAIGY